VWGCGGVENLRYGLKVPLPKGDGFRVRVKLTYYTKNSPPHSPSPTLPIIYS
jgi:hypothetical protein